MNQDEKSFVSKKISDFFNRISLFKGEIAYIATCDAGGNPNVTPIGSMRVVDESTVHVLQGMLPRTYANLVENPKATFVVVKKIKLFSMFKYFLKNSETPLGYRMYCSFVGIDESKDSIQNEFKGILTRFPFYMRRLALSFSKKNLQRLLRFKVLEIREIK